MEKTYPDISRILAAKARRRRALAALSWEEKVAMIEQMRRLRPSGMWRDRSPDENAASERKDGRPWIVTDTDATQQA